MENKWRPVYIQTLISNKPILILRAIAEIVITYKYGQIN
jgi:hypothetical protein